MAGPDAGQHVEPGFSEYLELDLSTVVPSIAGPKRPQDRIELSRAKEQFQRTCRRTSPEGTNGVDEAERESFPASDSPAITSSAMRVYPTHRTPQGRSFEMVHGAVAIASITSCTNTSNPSVMIAAALLAKKAVEQGLTAKPWVKTSMAPGSQVVTNYYEKAGLWPYLEKLGFHLVGYGCTTCIGNSGPLDEKISEAVQEHDLAVVSVLSGNRNFEGRINPDIKMNYLASPPLVIAYALAGTMDFDFESDPLGRDEAGSRSSCGTSGRRPDEVQTTIDASIDRAMFTKDYADVFTGDERWRALPTPEGDTFEWDPRVDLRPQAPVLRRHAGRRRRRSWTSTARACWPSWATR